MFSSILCFYWRRKWQPTPVFLPGKSYGQRSLAGQSMGLQRVGHDLATEQQNNIYQMEFHGNRHTTICKIDSGNLLYDSENSNQSSVTT